MNTTEIADRLEILELNSRYFWSVDTGDVQAYLKTWNPKGKSIAAYGSVEGHEALKDRFEQMQNAISKDKRHVVSNIVIEVINESTAVQKCYLTVFERSKKAEVISTAIYHDELIKTKNGWQFLKRTIEIDPSYKL